MRLYVLDNVTPPLVRIVAGVANVVHEMTFEVDGGVFVTHGEDGAHKAGSLHKLYAAVDLRTKNFPNDDAKMQFYKLLLAKFPAPRFDVLFEDRHTENEHIHIEDNSAKPRSVTT